MWNKHRPLTLAVLLCIVSSAQYAQTGPLLIGDRLPSLPVRLQNRSNDILLLSEIKKKLIILDFWNTRCTACLKAMPKIDALQKKFSGQLQIILVTEDNQNTVNELFKRIKIPKPAVLMVNGDTVLSRLFPHQSVPHHVWVDQNGVVRFVSQEYNTNESFIDSFLAGKTLRIETKGLINFDLRKRLQQIPDLQAEIQSYSSLYPHSAGIGRSLFGVITDSLREHEGLRIINKSLLFLYQIAYNGSMAPGPYSYVSRILFEVKDRSSFTAPTRDENVQDWTTRNEYCYESFLPHEKRSYLFTALQEDLKRFFPYRASVQKRKVRCLVLKDVGTVSCAKEKETSVRKNADGSYVFNNFTTGRLISWLQVNNPALRLPLVNATVYKGGVDLRLPADFQSLPLLNQDLHSSGLRFDEEEMELDMLVIEDEK